MKTDAQKGKPAETHFRVLQTGGNVTLLEVRPVTGRAHQIRVHLQASGHSVIGDELYGGRRTESRSQSQLALRAIRLAYRDPFSKRPVCIEAPAEEFMKSYGFGPLDVS